MKTMKTLMKPQTLLLSTLLSPFYLLTWLFTLSLFTPTHAADLTFTPATPLVEINKTITLSVQGAVGTVKWTTIEGTIQGDGLQVTYLAPAQAGLDAVAVLDSAGNYASVKMVITPPQTINAIKLRKVTALESKSSDLGTPSHLD